MTGGEVEHYIADVRELVRRLELGGVECEYLEGKDAPHDFPVLFCVSQAKRAGTMKRMQEWVQEQFAE